MTSASPASSIIDPLGRRTTYLYDGSSKLSGIMDVHGRITTFVVDGSGNLTKRITPELCVTELKYGTGYDDAHQLKAIIAPDGARTSFSYDANGWCSGIQGPSGDRYTYSYQVTVATAASCVGWYPEGVGFRGFHRHDEGCKDGEVTGCGQGTVLAGGDPAV